MLSGGFIEAKGDLLRKRRFGGGGVPALSREML